ncbi:EamA family transporter [Dermacoccus nishinomiyaensis]|nr:EamA family transporter [Dermacoccus nishinomiyaensis]
MAPSRFSSSSVMSSSTAPAVLMVIGSCTSLQFGASLATQLFGPLGATGVTTLRLGLAAVMLALVTRPRVRTWTRSQWTAVAAFGLALAGMNGMFYEAIARIPLGPAVAIEFLGPLGLATILSRKLKDFAWIVLALVGVMILGFDDAGGSLDLVGVAFVLGAGFFWALYILASERVGGAVDGAGGLAMALVVGTVALVPFGAQGAWTGLTDVHYLALAIGTAFLASVVPYALELSALRRLPKAVFGVLLALEPVIAALAGWLLLDQGFGATRALAVLLVVIAGAGSAITASRRDATAGVAAEHAPDELAASIHGG